MNPAITKPDWMEGLSDDPSPAEIVEHIRRKGRALANDPTVWIQLKQLFRNTIRAEGAVLWHRAEIAHLVCTVFAGDDEKKRRGVISQFAKEVGFSQPVISKAIEVYEAFKDPESRYPADTIRYTHYVEAIYTDDPHGWVRRAFEEGWTTEQLRLAIGEAKRAALPPPADAKGPDEVAFEQVEKRIQEIIPLLADTRMASLFARRLAQLAADTKTTGLFQKHLRTAE